MMRPVSQKIGNATSGVPRRFRLLAEGRRVAGRGRRTGVVDRGEAFLDEIPEESEAPKVESRG